MRVLIDTNVLLDFLMGRKRLISGLSDDNTSYLIEII